MIKKYELIKDESVFVKSGSNARSLSLSQCLECCLLISPDSKNELSLDEERNVLSDGLNNYSILDGIPQLYPTEVSDMWQKNTMLPMENYVNPLLQYVLLSQIKQWGDINAPLDSIPARKHQYRFKNFCSGLSGLILDVGCDRPSHSIQLFSSSCEYLGIDPYAGNGEFRIVGLGEILPITNMSMDAVIFNTSLDHILDYHLAIEEACRVLKPGGKIVIATYAWLDRATLLSDSVHFHHFREFEILGSLESYFQVKDIKRYEDPKHSDHRYGLYVLGETY